MAQVRNRSLFFWLLLAACMTPPAMAHRQVGEWFAQAQPDSPEQAAPQPAPEAAPPAPNPDAAPPEASPEAGSPEAEPVPDAAPPPPPTAPAELDRSFMLPEALPEGTTLRIEGSASMGVITRSLLERFEEAYPGTSVTLIEQPADPALQNLLAGTTDLAAIGRPLTDEEKAQGLAAVSVSREKIAVIVSEDNPFQGDVDSTTFVQIFRGEITNWSELGGPDLPIRLIDRPVTSDTRRALGDYALFSGDLSTGANAVPLQNDSTAEVVEALGNDGISYAIASQVLNQDNVRVLSMHQTLPDDPRYPYSQPRNYVYVQATTLPARVEAFLAFATNPEGQEAVAEAKAAEAADVAAAALPDRVAAMRPNGDGFVTGDRAGNLNFWTANGTSAGEPVAAHTGPVTALAFSPDGQRLISGGADGTIRFWDAVGTPIGDPINGGNGPVTSLVVQPDGTFFSASADGTLQRWDDTGNPTGEPISGHEDTVRALALSPDQETLISVSQDGTLRQWETATGAAKGEPVATDQGGLNALAVKPDGTLVTGGADGTVKQWSAGGEPVSGGGGPVEAPVEAPVEGTAEEPAEGAAEEPAEAQAADPAPVTALAVNPETGQVAIGDEAGGLRFLSEPGIPDGASAPDAGAPIDDLTFTPDGQRLVVSAGEAPQIRDGAGQPVAAALSDLPPWLEGLDLPPVMLDTWRQLQDLPPQFIWLIPIAIVGLLLWSVLRSLPQDEAEDSDEPVADLAREETPTAPDRDVSAPPEMSPVVPSEPESDDSFSFGDADADDAFGDVGDAFGDVGDTFGDADDAFEFPEVDTGEQPISGIFPEEAASTLDPKLKKARNLLREGVAQVEAGQPEAALESFNRAIEAADLEQIKADAADIDLVGVETVIARSLARRGAVLADLARSEEALHSFDRALEIDADDIAAWIGKGNLMRESGRVDEAIFCFDKAIELNPNLGAPWQGKGEALLKLGRDAEARRCFAKARALGDTESEIPTDLGAPVTDMAPPEPAAPVREPVPDDPDLSVGLPTGPGSRDNGVPEGLQDIVAGLPSEPEKPSQDGPPAPPIEVPPAVEAISQADDLEGDEVPASVLRGDPNGLAPSQRRGGRGFDISPVDDPDGGDSPAAASVPPEDAGITAAERVPRGAIAPISAPAEEGGRRMARRATAVTPDQPEEGEDAFLEGLPPELLEALQGIPDNSPDSFKSLKKPAAAKKKPAPPPPPPPANPRLRRTDS